MSRNRRSAPLPATPPPSPPPPSPPSSPVAPPVADDPSAALSLLQISQPLPRPRQKRGKYVKTLTRAERLDVFDMFVNQGFTAHHIAEVYATRGRKLPISTIYTLIRRMRTRGTLDPKVVRPRHSRYTESDKKIIIDLQDAHNDWTYGQLRTAWRERTASTLRMSNYMIGSFLNSGDFTSKNMSEVPVGRNTPENIEARKRYSREALQWDRDRVIFIDEVGFQRNQKRRRGRSRQGRPAYIRVPNCKSARINVCAAVSPRLGLITYKSLLTGWNGNEFRDFITHLCSILPNRSHCFIMDNVKFHKVEQVREVLSGLPIQYEIKYLPPYSPHLNPIEYCFHLWKSEIKRNDQLTITESLQQQIDKAARLITSDYVTRCLDHVYQVYTFCLEGKPLEEFRPLDRFGRPKALVDRVAQRFEQAERDADMQDLLDSDEEEKKDDAI